MLCQIDSAKGRACLRSALWDTSWLLGVNILT